MQADGIAQLHALIARLDAARRRLDAAADADAAVPVLEEMQGIAHEVATEVDRRRRAAADEAERDDAQLGLL